MTEMIKNRMVNERQIQNNVLNTPIKEVSILPCSLLRINRAGHFVAKSCRARDFNHVLDILNIALKARVVLIQLCGRDFVDLLFDEIKRLEVSLL